MTTETTDKPMQADEWASMVLKQQPAHLQFKRAGCVYAGWNLLDGKLILDSHIPRIPAEYVPDYIVWLQATMPLEDDSGQAHPRTARTDVLFVETEHGDGYRCMCGTVYALPVIGERVACMACEREIEWSAKYPHIIITRPIRHAQAIAVDGGI